MLINISNFGDILISRPAGREAFLLAKAYAFKEINQTDEIILDFDKIKVLTPSWADEFITGIRQEVSNLIQCINTDNPSVQASLDAIFK